MFSCLEFKLLQESLLFYLYIHRINMTGYKFGYTTTTPTENQYLLFKMNEIGEGISQLTSSYVFAPFNTFLFILSTLSYSLYFSFLKGEHDWKWRTLASFLLTRFSDINWKLCLKKLKYYMQFIQSTVILNVHLSESFRNEIGTLVKDSRLW